jgi:outer membrane protein OmpA-like peptidoglycan-associated protein
VPAPFATIRINQKLAYALLAGTMLPTVTLAQSGSASDVMSVAPSVGAIILAQATPPIDPKTGKPVPPKGPPAKGPTAAPPRATVAPSAAPPMPKGMPPRQLVQPAPTGVSPPPVPGIPPKGPQPRLGQPHPGPAPTAVPSPTVPPAASTPAIAPKGVQPRLGQPAPVPVAPTPSGTPPRVTTPVGAAPPHVGTVDILRGQRHERTEGSRVVIEEPGGRTIVRDGGTVVIRHDDTQRFGRWGAPRIETRGAEQFAYVTRPGGVQIITVTDAHGRLLRRVRRGPDGREVVIIDNRGPSFGTGVAVGLGVGLTADVLLNLAPPVVTIPRERYIVAAGVAPAALLYEALDAPPVVAIERPYSLDEIRYNVALRDRMPRIDIDSITFATGAWEVESEQQVRLEDVAGAIRRVLDRRPDEVFLIEGHTDAVGSDVDNLSLSDRRAESVAVILTDAYQIPPENLVTQGYGAQYLKIPTDGPSRENRRVTVRRITPLLHGEVATR